MANAPFRPGAYEIRSADIALLLHRQAQATKLDEPDPLDPEPMEGVPYIKERA